MALLWSVGNYVLTIFDIRLSHCGIYVAWTWLVTGHQLQKKVEILSPDTFGQDKMEIKKLGETGSVAVILVGK